MLQKIVNLIHEIRDERIMNIAIFTGGDSSESVISVKSAENMAHWLVNAGHACYTINVSGKQWTLVDRGQRIDLDHPGLQRTGDGLDARPRELGLDEHDPAPGAFRQIHELRQSASSRWFAIDLHGGLDQVVAPC